MKIDGTTIVAVKRDGKTAIAGDGQVTMGESVVMKSSAVKVRRIFNNQVIVGFSGSVSDAFNLVNKLDDMLQKFSGNLLRACIELSNLWRTDKMSRNLEAMLIVANKDTLLVLTGDGNIMDPEGGVCAVGSGGNYALAAARALQRNTTLSAKEIAVEAIKTAGEICIFTNDHITVEEV